MLHAEQVHQLELRRVRVLILIHHHVAILRAAGFEDGWMFPEQFEHQQKQVIEVHRVAGFQRAVVASNDVLGHGGRALVTRLCRSDRRS